MSLDIEKVQFLVKGTQTPASSAFSTLTDIIQYTFSDDLNNGTGPDLADQIYHSSARNLAASANETFDLAGGIADQFGNTLTMATVKLIVVKNTSAVAHIEVGNGTNPWEGWTIATGSSVTVAPGGLFVLYDPTSAAMEVTASTGDILKITNNDGSNAATFDLILVGASSQTT